MSDDRAREASGDATDDGTDAVTGHGTEADADDAPVPPTGDAPGSPTGDGPGNAASDATGDAAGDATERSAGGDPGDGPPGDEHEGFGGSGRDRPRERIASVGEVPPGSSFLFTVRDRSADEEREAILVGFEPATAGATGGTAGATEGPASADAGGTADGENVVVADDAANPDANHAIAAWINECQHLTHIRLDKGSGASMRGDEILCTNHGAMFEVDTGLCTYGPCEGAYLEGVAVAVRDGSVYLDDPNFEFVRAGPIERDPLDLASRSNVEF